MSFEVEGETMIRMNDEAGPIDLEVRDLVIAGWAGRDQEAVDHHVEELRALGVAPPSRTPLFYRVGASLLTTEARIEVVGEGTSGEAEAVLFATPDGWRVGLGSDHTDREAEAYSVALSKQACPKPVCPELWSYDAVAEHWDALVLRSWIHRDGERIAYQEGTLAGLLSASDLVGKLGGLADGAAMFCGTLPTIGGLTPATRFEMALEDPVLGRSMSHAYDIDVLPVVS